jgi:hypothetical protein
LQSRRRSCIYNLAAGLGRRKCFCASASGGV